MAATKAAVSANGNGAAAKAKEAGESVASAARTAKGPAITAGATMAGLAGGLVLGARMGSNRRKVLGLPVGRKRPVVRAAEALGKVALRTNRRSPVEVLLDGLTHRRGAHKRES